MYADDIILLSSSVIELQKMLDICIETAADIDLKFNPAKCKCIVFGRNRNILCGNLSINDKTIIIFPDIF